MLPCRNHPRRPSYRAGLCYECERNRRLIYDQAHRGVRRELLATTPQVCHICGKPGGPMDAHHLVPVKYGRGRGGVVWAHPSCHRGRENRTVALG